MLPQELAPCTGSGEGDMDTEEEASVTAEAGTGTATAETGAPVRALSALLPQTEGFTGDGCEHAIQQTVVLGVCRLDP
uniref:Uncharacterized protein n=1 Tax=Chromera velia CCMP2878 TaxID=1169474 RepID=A0A0G4HWV8_9ALVE|eukprot:Cvel_32816.t1-p1 / transcript=Cvel_32816.t1 / gene=Cvel_32816 / organism=Chromera_velia_CCMP2878 / gene_product=hypothetical protein / transcript_product=hypothetical protein / location=Cvel_scaffold5190:2368-3182(-) / protein_length=77 / sequence_SO=supercontig / SO=protein_coding / is_pseudo=false